jgi:hypothetical protein
MKTYIVKYKFSDGGFGSYEIKAESESIARDVANTRLGQHSKSATIQSIEEKK